LNTGISERRARIVVLLENYNDVEAGWRDQRGDGERLPLMCRPWNTPAEGYPELDHQLGCLKTQQPRLYWHLAETYFRSTRRRVLQCPRCRGVMPSWSSVNFHKHGHSNVAVVPRVLMVRKGGVSDEMVDAAIDWLEQHWRGSVFVPDELLGMEGAA
jgi:hypothetical protein